jgi:CPA2 family monovalent cation:H+ antiporter-2
MEERRLLDTRRGRIAIGWLIVEDLAMVLALVLLPALAGALGAGEEVGGPASLGALGHGPWQGGRVRGLHADGRSAGDPVGAGTRGRAPARANCSRSAVLAIALGVAFGAAELFGVSSRWARSSPACCSTSPKLSHKAAPIRCRCAMPSRCCSSSRSGMLFDPSILVDHPLLGARDRA